MISIHRDLHVVVPTTPDPRPLVAIERLSGSVRDICWSGKASICFSQTASLLICSQLRQLLLEPFRLRGQRFGRLLPVGGVKLAQVAGDALLQLGTPPLHLCPRQVPVPVVHGLNLLPSMATLAVAKRPISRQSSTKRAHTLRSPKPLSLRKSAIVL